MGVLVIAWAACGLLGYFIGKEKYRPIDGAIYGFLLGPIGVVIAFCMDDLAGKSGYKPEPIRPEEDD